MVLIERLSTPANKNSYRSVSYDLIKGCHLKQEGMNSYRISDAGDQFNEDLAIWLQAADC